MANTSTDGPISWESVTKTDLAWLAGLLEGEGYFGDRLIRGTRMPRLVLQMADRDVVERAAALMGGNRVQTIRMTRGDKAHWQNQHRVMVAGHTALDVMRAIKPYMGQRRAERIDGLLDSEYATKPRGNRGTFGWLKEAP